MIKYLRKMITMMLTASLFFGLTGMVSYGAASKKITSVSLTVTSAIKLGEELGTQGIEISSDNSKYSISSFEVENMGFEWMEEDIPKVKVYLTATEGYYFSLTSSNIKLDGAKYVTATKQDSSRTLVLTMTLPPLSEQVDVIESVSFSEDGSAVWTKAQGAGSYEVKLLRDGNGIGGIQSVTETNYNFASLMTKEANYSVRVRAVNKVKTDNKSLWAESANVYVSNEAAAKFREAGGGSAPITENTNGTWKQDARGWWYQNGNDSFTANNWQLINGKWYYFNEKGYTTSGWISWRSHWYYCMEDGAMMLDGVTPDGYRVGIDGAWIQ